MDNKTEKFTDVGTLFRTERPKEPERLPVDLGDRGERPTLPLLIFYNIKKSEF